MRCGRGGHHDRAVVLPGAFGDGLYSSLTVGASGAIYGILMAYALYSPNRRIYMYFLFPVPVKYFVMIIGAISLLSATGGPGGGVAHATHLGGLAVGYLYLKGRRLRLGAEMQVPAQPLAHRPDAAPFRCAQGRERRKRGPWIH